MILIYAIRLFVNNPSISAIGLLLSATPILLLMGYFFIVGTARTSRNLWLLLGTTSLGFAIVFIERLRSNADDTTLIMAAVALVGIWAYVFWYSKFDRSSSKIQLHTPLPAFSLTDLHGNSINAASFAGKPSLLIFYRGNWCPLCMVQIKEVASDYQELVSKGVRIALISPQSEKHTQSLANKFNVPFEYYIDQDNQAAKSLGIFAQNGLPFGLQVFGYQSDTVMPTVIITDSENIVQYVDITDNYRVRPEPQTFQKLLNDIDSRPS
ncbi:MAG: redoxin domain-containing protein [Kangiellaceae bacterium]|nr:redoxin domain-containing protein [Kangiellaceae bacterium]